MPLLTFLPLLPPLSAPTPGVLCLYSLADSISSPQVAAASATKMPKSAVPAARASGLSNVRAAKQEAASASSPPAATAPPVVSTGPPSAAGSPPDAQQAGNTEQVVASPATTRSVEPKLESRAQLNLVVNGSLSSMTDRSSKAPTSQTPSDDTSQRADSSSELGTKPPSLDGKSITSGTTFALDEKESLRPDDSASVKAAAEDDDAFSLRGSYIAGSRMGSDLAARIQRIQIGDMPPRALPANHMLVGSKNQGAGTPQSGISDKQVVADPKVSLVGGTATPDGLAPNAFYSQNPDEKLLEAMQSSKDRLFLLRLEQQVIEFVQDSKYVVVNPLSLPSACC